MSLSSAYCLILIPLLADELFWLLAMTSSQGRK